MDSTLSSCSLFFSPLCSAPTPNKLPDNSVAAMEYFTNGFEPQRSPTQLDTAQLGANQPGTAQLNTAQLSAAETNDVEESDPGSLGRQLPMSLRVLIVDDDHRLYDLLSTYLEENDAICAHAPEGQSALAALPSGGFDAVILDIMMPGIDGLTVLRKIRETSGVPVIMLTAKGDETDRVVGLELGADDYMSKPFSPRELLARIKAVLRRGKPNETGSWLKMDDVELNRISREVKVAGERVELTGLEFDLLAALIERPGRVVSRTALLEHAGRTDTLVNERAVDVHISHLRRKIRDHERTPRLIQTVRGVGYVMGRSGD